MRSRTSLFASVVLNLFLLALIGGHLLHAKLPPGAFESGILRHLLQAESTMAPDDARIFREVMAKEAPDYQAALFRLKEDQDRIRARILATPFEPNATEAALVTWGRDWNSFLAAFQRPLVDAVAQISPAGRQALVARSAPSR